MLLDSFKKETGKRGKSVVQKHLTVESAKSAWYTFKQV